MKVRCGIRQAAGMRERSASGQRTTTIPMKVNLERRLVGMERPVGLGNSRRLLAKTPPDSSSVTTRLIASRENLTLVLVPSSTLSTTSMSRTSTTVAIDSAGGYYAVAAFEVLEHVFACGLLGFFGGGGEEEREHDNDDAISGRSHRGRVILPGYGLGSGGGLRGGLSQGRTRYSIESPR